MDDEAFITQCIVLDLRFGAARAAVTSNTAQPGLRLWWRYVSSRVRAGSGRLYGSRAAGRASAQQRTTCPGHLFHHDIIWLDGLLRLAVRGFVRYAILTSRA